MPITCCVSIDDRLIAPVLRHELEHARQWKRGGRNPTFELVGLIERILNRGGYAGLSAAIAAVRPVVWLCQRCV